MNDLGAKACEAWLREHGEGLPWGQVVAHPCPNGWELRHVEDAGRDAAGAYRGVVETVQDFTAIRALEGQRRLLDW